MKMFLKRSFWAMLTIYLAIWLVISLVAGVILEDFKNVINGGVVEKTFRPTEKFEEAFAESMMSDKVEVSFNGDYVLLTLNGAFLFDSGKADIKTDAVNTLD